nr:diguanylate cyclase [uncultured Gellertiella sp.]
MLWRRPDRGTSRTRNWMVWAIYTACSVLFLLFVASIILVLNFSVWQANVIGVAGERKLVQREFQREIDEMVRYQSDVSFWDATVAQVRARAFNQFFVKRHLEEGLWSDYGFSWIVFTTLNHQTKLVVKEGVQQDNTTSADSLLFWVDDLIEQANKAYDKVLVPTENGYRIYMPPSDRDLLIAPVPDIHAADMRMVDGKMSIVVVQAVVPRSLFVAERYREPTFMVSVKPVSRHMLAQMDERLAISGLHVVKGEGSDLKLDSFSPVGNGFTDGPFVVAWNANAPGPLILSATLPRIIILTLFAALSMSFIGYRFAALVRALQRSESANRFLAKHDGLTGLANRIGLDEYLRQLMQRPPSEPFAVLALDLDKFKAVNDRHGHAAGDAVLMAIAERFRDRIADQGVVARLGGDEFLVLVYDARFTTDVTLLANGLVLDAQQPIEFDGMPLAVGCSAGIAIFPDHGENARGILQAADIALYAAKNGGRNRAVLSGSGVLQEAAFG